MDDFLDGTPMKYDTPEEQYDAESLAVAWENVFRYMFYRKMPGYQEGDEREMRPRPQYGFTAEQDGNWYDDSLRWDEYFGWGEYGGKGLWKMVP